MASKEDAKNMALLFFIDHLMQKNGSRTIHDLSCQFGSRGFSEEMREAVGSTQEGLSEFLTLHPSLFQIEGDQISLTMYSDLTSGSNANPLLQNFGKDRDYEREAIEFFEAKLIKFGPELQVKSLLGHRSQASPEIRLVSGRHVKDFTEFLASQVDNFVVEGDRVRLLHLPEPTDPSGEIDEDGQLLTGARAKQAAVEFLKMFLEQQEDQPVPMDQLYKKFCDRFSHTVRQDVATNPKELLQFLKLNRAIFFIRSNKVSLVKNRSPGSAEQSESDGGGGQTATFSDGPSVVVNNGSTPRSGDESSSSGGVTDNVQVLRSVKQTQLAVEELLRLPPPHVISLDCKLVNLDGKEFITLIAFGTVCGKFYVFDVAPSAAIVREGGLKALLGSENITKVMHDCKRVSNILNDQYDISLTNVFDTQVAHSILQHQRTNKPIHEIKPASFLTVQRLYYPQSIMQSNANPRKIHRRDPKFWSTRPLTDEIIQMAVEEVQALVPHIYQFMQSSIRPEFQSLLRQLCNEQVNFYVKEQEVHQVRKQRRDDFTMNVITDKLSHDPTGRSLSNKEKKLLQHVEQNGGSVIVDPDLDDFVRYPPPPLIPPPLLKETVVNPYVASAGIYQPPHLRNSQAVAIRPSTVAPPPPLVNGFATPPPFRPLSVGGHPGLQNGVANHGGLVSMCGVCGCHGNQDSNNNNRKKVATREFGCQTMSTGDVVITKLFNGI